MVGQSAVVLQNLASEHQLLITRANTHRVCDMKLEIRDGGYFFHTLTKITLKGASRQSLDEKLGTAAKTQHQVQRALPLDVVVGEGAKDVQLLAREDEFLLFGGDALLILNLIADCIDGVGRLDFKGDGLAGQGLDEYLHAAAQTRQVQSAGRRSGKLRLISGHSSEKTFQ